jgi:adenosylhomocysteine nucleosidase
MSSGHTAAEPDPGQGAAQVLVCFAVRQEAGGFRVPLTPVTDRLITGMGMRRTSQTILHYLESHQPQLVLTCGFAGGLKPTHKRGTVLVDDSEAGAFRGRFNGPGTLPGRFVHSDRILTTAAEKAQLFRSSGGDAVEMESSAIRAACREHRTPVIVARAVSDTATEDLPMDFNRFSRPDGSLSLPHLLVGLATSPSAIPPLMAFQTHLKLAARNLGKALERFLALDDLF